MTPGHLWERPDVEKMIALSIGRMKGAGGFLEAGDRG
jgi:hypothetical protein